MIKKKLIPIILTTSMMAAFATGCSFSSIKVSDSLVGKGEVYKNTDNLKKLTDKETAAVMKAFNTKYADKEMETAEIDLDINADLDVGDSEMSMNMKLDLSDTMKMDLKEKKISQNLSGNIQMFGMTIDMGMESYLIDENGKIMSYSKTSSAGESGDWIKEESDADLFTDNSFIPGELNQDSIKAIYKDEESKAYVLEIDGNVLDSLNDSFDNNIADSESFDLDFSKTSAFMTIDSGIGIVGYYIDLKDGLQLDEAEMSANEFSIQLAYKSLNDKIDITIPAEAKGAVTGEIEEDPNMLIQPTLGTETTKSETNSNSNIKLDVFEDAPDMGTAKLLINGKSVTLPCTISDLESVGLETDEALDVEPNLFEFIEMKTGKEDSIFVSIENFKNITVPSDQCVVTGLNYDSFLCDETIDFSVYGVSKGMSPQEVDNILGAPTDTYTGSGGTVSNYYTYDSCFITVTFRDSISHTIDVSVY